MVHSFTAYSIGEAWLHALKLVLANGQGIKDGIQDILEVTGVTIEMINPQSNDDIISKYGNRTHIEQLASNFNELSPVKPWGYSYAQRLYAYNSTNQIEAIIQKLTTTPLSKSATISLLKPAEDTRHAPCLTTLDFKIRNGSLLITAFFRSQDIGKKMYGDAMALLTLGLSMIGKLQCKSVTLKFFVASAHIYEEDIVALRAVINNAAKD